LVSAAPWYRWAARFSEALVSNRVSLSHSVRDLVAGVGLQVGDYLHSLALPERAPLSFSVAHPNTESFS